MCYKRAFAFLTLVALLTFPMVTVVPGVTYAQECPKLSPASLDMDTAGCPSTFDGGVVEKRTEWELDKTAATPGPLDATTGAASMYDITVTEGPTTRVLQSTGQIVITNSGEQSPFLESVVVHLQRMSLLASS